MKKITYTLTAAAIIAALAMGLTSCGGDNNGNTGTNTNGRETVVNTGNNNNDDDNGTRTGDNIVEDVSDMLK